jgi:hypothetical protein
MRSSIEAGIHLRLETIPWAIVNNAAVNKQVLMSL